MVRALKWSAFLFAATLGVALFVPDGSPALDLINGLGALLLLVVSILGLLVAATSLRRRFGRNASVRDTTPVPPGSKGRAPADTAPKKSHVDYVIKRRDWTGEGGIQARGYDVYHRGDSRSLFSNNMRPQGQTWRSTLFLIKLAGVSFRPDVLQKPQFSLGSRVTLIPDPNNPHSRTGKAVAIWDADRNFHIGYVPEADTALVFDRMQSEGGVWGFVLREYWKGRKRVGLEVLLVPPDTRVKFPSGRVEPMQRAVPT